jgi:hypothetical protein
MAFWSAACFLLLLLVLLSQGRTRKEEVVNELLKEGESRDGYVEEVLLFNTSNPCDCEWRPWLFGGDVQFFSHFFLQRVKGKGVVTSESERRKEGNNG